MVSSGVTDTVLKVLGIVGDVAAFGLYLSPVSTYYTICRERSTGQYSPVPYIVTLLNSMLWAFYGSTSVASLMFILSINVAGAVIEACYVTIHLVFGSHSTRRFTSILLVLISISFGAVVSGALLMFHSKDDRKKLVGSACVIVGVLMYAAPLSVMRKVMRSKSVESMPFLLSFAGFWNGSVWTAYGAIKRDLFIYIPGGVGALLSAAQLVLYFVYYKRDVTKPSLLSHPNDQVNVQL